MDVLKGLLGTLAPTIATALGGPLAGGAVKFLSNKLLGNGDASADELLDAIQGADPETLAKIKEIDASYKIEMRKLDVDLVRIAANDRDSAREMQIKTGSHMPGFIALAALIGFFGILTALATVEMPDGSADALKIMLGSLGTLVSLIGNFYFGSSAGSREKTAHMAKR